MRVLHGLYSTRRGYTRKRNQALNAIPPPFEPFCCKNNTILILPRSPQLLLVLIYLFELSGIMASFPLSPPPLANAWTQIQDRLRKAVVASVLRPALPTIIAVSKQQPLERIIEACEMGIRHFGENKIQDAYKVWPELKVHYPDINLHLIGSLQSNKAEQAVALFDAIHTIDRPKIADAIHHEMAKQGKNLTLFIQVNTGEEPQKAGVTPANLSALLNHCQTIGLNIEGLMCIPPADIPPAPHFAFLHKLAIEHGLKQLSMGMSDDYEVAAKLGATHVRIGTALFGARQS